MCYGGQTPLSRDDLTPSTLLPSQTHAETLRSRLAETEARLERARAREAELSRRLEEMKRLLSVMEILEDYLKRRLREHQETVSRLFSPIMASNQTDG